AASGALPSERFGDPFGRSERLEGRGLDRPRRLCGARSELDPGDLGRTGRGPGGRSRGGLASRSQRGGPVGGSRASVPDAARRGSGPGRGGPRVRTRGLEESARERGGQPGHGGARGHERGAPRRPPTHGGPPIARRGARGRTGGRFRLHERGGDARLRADRAGDRLEPVEHAPRPRPGPPDGDRRHLRRDLARGGEPRPRPSGDPRDRGGDHRAFISCPPGATTLIVARPSLSPNGRETWDRFSAGPWSAGPRPGRFQRPPGRGRTDRRRSANARGPSYPEPPPSRGGPNDPALAPGPSGGSSGPPVLAAAGRPPPERPARSAGLFRRGYRGREAARASDPPRERAVPHAREPALPSGGGGQRPRVRRP